MTWWQRMLVYAALAVAPPLAILGPHASTWPREVVALIIGTAALYAIVFELLFWAVER